MRKHWPNFILAIVMAAAAALVFTGISAPTLRGVCRADLLTGASG